MKLPALAVAAALLAAPAAYADQPTAGLACSLHSVNDLTGVVLNDPDIQTGTLSSGPVAVAGASSVQVHCEVRVDADPNGTSGTTLVSAQSGSTGSVGVLAPTAVSYDVEETDPVWLCFTASWVDAVGGGTHASPTRCDQANVTWIRLPTGDYVHTVNAETPFANVISG